MRSSSFRMMSAKAPIFWSGTKSFMIREVNFSVAFIGHLYARVQYFSWVRNTSSTFLAMLLR